MNHEIMMRKALFVSGVVISLVLAGCGGKNSVVEPPPAKHELTTNFTCSPADGTSPATFHLVAGGSCSQNDVKNYRINFGNTAFDSPVPFSKDTTVTLDKVDDLTIPVSETISDKAGNSKSSTTGSVSVHKGPYLSQTVTLVNNVELKDSIVLHSVSNANLEIYLAGNLVKTVPLTSSVVKVFNYANDGFNKGDFTFKLSGSGLENIATGSIPDYPAVADFSGYQNFVLVEDSSRTITLPVVTDPNKGDVASYINASPLDAKTSATIVAPNLLKVKTLRNVNGGYTEPWFIGPFSIKLEYGAPGASVFSNVSGNINVDIRPKVEFFTRPNKTDLNYLGSGDINKDNAVNDKDTVAFNLLVANKYLGPFDDFIFPRADMNVNHVLDPEDKQILKDYVDKRISHRIVDWEDLTVAEQKSLADKVLAYQMAFKYSFPGLTPCNQYADQFMLNSRPQSAAELAVYDVAYNYDKQFVGLYNLPMMHVISSGKDASGKPLDHAWAGLATGDNLLDYNNFYNLNPSNGKSNTQPGEVPLNSTNISFSIRGSPVKSYQGSTFVWYETYVNWNIINGIPERTSWDNASYKLIPFKQSTPK